MKLHCYFPFTISFATLALCRPATHDTTNLNYPIPSGAFPSSSLPSPIPSAITPDSSSGENSRVGRAIIANHCSFPVYVWSVGTTIRSEATISPGRRFTETYRRDLKTGGIALKITTAQGGLFTNAPQTIFAYNVKDGQVWYDLSDVFGDPFRGHRVSVLPSNPLISWPDGVPPRGSEVRVQPESRDLTLDLC